MAKKTTRSKVSEEAYSTEPLTEEERELLAASELLIRRHRAELRSGPKPTNSILGTWNLFVSMVGRANVLAVELKFPPKEWLTESQTEDYDKALGRFQRKHGVPGVDQTWLLWQIDEEIKKGVSEDVMLLRIRGLANYREAKVRVAAPWEAANSGLFAVKAGENHVSV